MSKLPTACPKPKPKAKGEPKGRRQWNSTIPVSTKPIARSALVSSKPRKAIPRVNRERAARNAKSYKAGLAKYRKSETYQVVAARAGGRCEFLVALDPNRLPRVLDVRVDRERPLGYTRCSRAGNQHHHCTYKDFGGNEMPEQMLVGCKGCHDYVESMKPAHRGRSVGLSASTGGAEK